MNDRKSERRGLGRGLSALMADVGMAEAGVAQGQLNSGVREVPIEQVKPNPDQPRRRFDKDALEDLANSIRGKGVLQPLLVRERDGGFEIVAGERRWRAAQVAQLHSVPVLVRAYSDTEVLEVAIIENIQRADLSPVEEANAYRQLIERFGHTQEKVAESLGKSRSYITNSLRLLNLPVDVIGLLETGAISAGHARALVTSSKASKIARKIVDDGMTVREVERVVREEKPGQRTESRAYRGKRSAKDADTLALEADVSGNLGMSVKIAHEAHTGSGILTIRYNTLEDLDLLCRVLSAIRSDVQV
jgi:ParB family transcriptional regulator, chromosome partitioning protein